jgi:hypothetical protein
MHMEFGVCVLGLYPLMLILHTKWITELSMTARLVLSALWRLRQEDLKFKTSLGYTGGPSLKNKMKQNNRSQ